MQRFRIIPALMLTALLGLSGAAGASVGKADTTAPASVQETPRQLVQQTADQVLARLQKQRSELKSHPERIYGLVKGLILPHFDFDRMSRWVLGRYWREATPAQRQQFEAQFQDLLVRTYGYALLRYDHERIEYLPTHTNANTREVVVHTQIRQSDQSSIPVDYLLYMDKNHQWKVFDLSIDGVSLITNYRQSFTEQIQQVGMNGLIDRLARHNQASTG